MKPEVLIVVSGGVVEDVQANLPGIEVTINDTDQQRVGEPYTSTFEARCVTPDGGQPGTPLTEAERSRFDREMQGNFEGSKTTVDILLHLISNTPAAAAAFREWLEGAEEDSEARTHRSRASRHRGRLGALPRRRGAEHVEREGGVLKYTVVGIYIDNEVFSEHIEADTPQAAVQVAGSRGGVWILSVFEGHHRNLHTKDATESGADAEAETSMQEPDDSHQEDAHTVDSELL